MASLASARMAETVAAEAPPAQIASSSQALLVVDDDRVCIEASLGACRLLGLGRSEVTGQAVEDLFEADSGERFEQVWRAFRSSGGHAEPFALEAPATAVDVALTVIVDILPGRHLISLDPVRGQSSGRPATSWRPPNRGPSAREREVLGLLARGSTDAEIASMLGLSSATVQTHVRNAKAKLGAKTRAQAVALALGQGLIDAR
jgi:DNA-binding CsgD family transcriptional regulator